MRPDPLDEVDGFNAEVSKDRGEYPKLEDWGDEGADRSGDELVEDVVEEDESDSDGDYGEKGMSGGSEPAARDTGGELPTTADPEALRKDQDRKEDDPAKDDQECDGVQRVSANNLTLGLELGAWPENQEAPQLRLGWPGLGRFCIWGL